jgi:hypothetical protein
MRLEFVSDRVSHWYVVLRGRWSNIIVLNVHAPIDEKLEQVFDRFPKYHMKILSGDFYAKVGRENIFKLTNGNESLHQGSNDNVVRTVNLATSQNLVKGTMFPRRTIHKYTYTSPDGKTHNQIDHILIDRRRYLRILDVRSLG